MITGDEKRRILALYWGQDILDCSNIAGGKYRNQTVGQYNIERALYLEVKPLSKISDEDAIKLAKFYRSSGKPYVKSRHKDHVFVKWKYGLREERLIIKDNDIEYSHSDCDNYCGEEYELPVLWECVDFIRSKGYAWSYMNYSVEELVDYGVFKLVEK